VQHFWRADASISLVAIYSHPEALDLPVKINSVKRPSVTSRAGNLESTGFSQETDSRDVETRLGNFRKISRPTSYRTRGWPSIHWTARAGHHGRIESSTYFDYHQKCSRTRPGSSAEARRPSRRLIKSRRQSLYSYESVFIGKGTKSLAHVFTSLCSFFLFFPFHSLICAKRELRKSEIRMSSSGRD